MLRRVVQLAGITLIVCFCESALSANTIVSVTGPNAGNTAYVVGGFVHQFLAASWSSSQAYSNVRVSFEGEGFSPVTAYLTTKIGAGTTVADQVGVNTVSPISGLTDLFIGLSLPPGTYFLVLASGPTDNVGWFISDSGPSTVTVDTGVTLGSQYLVSGGADLSYPPASLFGSYFNSPSTGWELSFRVTGDAGSAVPEPSPWMLLGIPLCGFYLGPLLRRTSPDRYAANRW
jgi:hypothetical protein